MRAEISPQINLPSEGSKVRLDPDHCRGREDKRTDVASVRPSVRPPDVNKVYAIALHLSGTVNTSCNYQRLLVTAEDNTNTPPRKLKELEYIHFIGQRKIIV